MTKVKRSHAEALAVEVLSPGPKRVEAPCEHYPPAAAAGSRISRTRRSSRRSSSQVRDSLIRLGGIAEPPLEEIVPAESIFHYRNKMEYSFAQTPDGPTLGLHKAGRWDEILEIEQCWLTTDLGNAIRNRVRDWAREERLVSRTRRRITPATSATWSFARDATPARRWCSSSPRPARSSSASASSRCCASFPEVRSIHWAVNASVNDSTNLPTTLLWGEDAIEEQLLGLRFRVRPNAFLQTNTQMAEKLYALAIEFAGLTGDETVYDLYCGIGTIGLAMAPHALTVWGIEVSEESVACALENADLNGITNAAFFAGNVGVVLEELRERAGEPDVVVVDPPRAGLAGKALKRLGEMGAPRIVYVSCNPTTLAGDVKKLQEEYGYELVRARPVDMFPHTPHVETVALLERR